MKKITVGTPTPQISLAEVTTPGLVVVKDINGSHWLLIEEQGKYRRALLTAQGIKGDTDCIVDWKKEVTSNIQNYGYTAYVFDTLYELGSWLNSQSL